MFTRVKRVHHTLKSTSRFFFLIYQFLDIKLINLYFQKPLRLHPFCQ